MSAYWLDLLILAVIGLSVITGLMRGFVKELVALGVWFLAIWLAYQYSWILDPWLKSYIKDISARTAVSFVLILFSILIAGGIINGLLSFILKRSGLNGTDRLLGMGFGLIRGVFIVGLVMTAVKMTALPYEDYAKNSTLYAKFDPVVDWIYVFMPEFLKQAKAMNPDADQLSSGLIESA